MLLYMKEIFLFIRPAVSALTVVCLIVDCLLIYFQYKYNIYPKEVVEEIAKVDVFNFKGKKKLVFDIGGRLIVIPIIVCAMFSNIRPEGVIAFGLIYCVWVSYLSYKVFRLYYKQSPT